MNRYIIVQLCCKLFTLTASLCRRQKVVQIGQFFIKKTSWSGKLKWHTKIMLSKSSKPHLQPSWLWYDIYIFTALNFKDLIAMGELALRAKTFGSSAARKRSFSGVQLHISLIRKWKKLYITLHGYKVPLMYNYANYSMEKWGGRVGFL